jgi:hypothetical protein
VKPDKIRLCIDPKNLNEAVKREHYPMKTIESVLTRLPEAKVFSTLDAVSGFWQIPLDEESSLLTCFNTPFGRYKFNNLVPRLFSLILGARPPAEKIPWYCLVTCLPESWR